jgi:hypothetical protein
VGVIVGVGVLVHVGVGVNVGVLVGVWVGVEVNVGVFVGVFVGVWVGVEVGVGVHVGVDVHVGVFVGVELGVGVLVNVKVGVGTGVAGRMETAPIAQDLPVAVPSAQVIVTDGAPGLVLAAPMTSFGDPPVVQFHACAWPASAVAESASPRTPTVSKTSSPTALETVTVGVVVLSPAPTNVPRGVAWSTSENDSAPAPKTADALMVTVTVEVPLAGATRLQSSIRLCVTWPFWAPTRDRDCAP